MDFDHSRRPESGVLCFILIALAACKCNLGHSWVAKQENFENWELGVQKLLGHM